MLAASPIDRRPLFSPPNEREPEPVQDEPVLRLHNFERWYIVRSQPNCEAKAAEYLKRENFEVFYAKRQVVMTVPIPANRISSKTRHRRRSETREVITTYPIYPGILFARRIFGGYDLSQSFDMPGVIGLCCFGETPATVEDYTVELLRLAEARGKFSYRDEIKNPETGKIRIVEGVVEFDQYSFSRAEKDIKTALRDRAAEEKAKKEKADNPPDPVNISPRTINHVDKSGKALAYIEELGRITRIITSHGPIYPPTPRVPRG